MSTGRRLLWALGLSLLLHLLLLLAPAPHLPAREAATPAPLLARLQPSPPAPRSRPKPRPPVAARPAPAPAPAPPAARMPASAPPADTSPADGAPATDGTAQPAAPAAEVRSLPSRIAITYTLIKGEQGLVVGRITHRWEAADGQYTVTSLAQATGIFALFVPGTLIQVSRGSLTPAGLRPDLFWIQRGQSGNRTESAGFDWATATLRLGKAGEDKTVTLAAGTQDVLSVLYQLALTAPHDAVLELPVTNGRKFDRYRYRVVGEEPLDTPLGTLTTEHLEKVREPGEDGLELWLARDYHYLPVKLRLTDRKGEVAEQLISEIRAE